MRSPLRTLALSLALVAGSLAAWSYPTFFGDTGIINAPTADIVPVTHFDLAMDYTKVSDGGTSATALPVRFAYGVGTATELSLTFMEASNEDAGGFDVLGGSMKIAIRKEQVQQPGLGFAVGVRAAAFDNYAADSERNLVEGYAVLSQTIFRLGDLVDNGGLLRVHGGVSYSRFSGGAASANFVNGFLGVSYLDMRGFALGLDYLPELEEDGVVFRSSSISGVFRQRLSEGFWAEAGVSQAFGSEENTLFLGLNYHYGEDLDPMRSDPVDMPF